MKNREPNFELLRIITMFMILILHYLNHYGALFFDLKQDGLTLIALTLESSCIVAVNIYVLLSGFFLSKKHFTIYRIVNLLRQVLFYTISIPIVLALTGIISVSDIINPYYFLRNVFPIQSGHYWFVSAYVVMYLFSPFLNAALEHLSKKQIEFALCGLFVFFCVGKSISPLQFATDRCGYDFGWFMVLYLTGGYIRRFCIPFLKTRSRCIIIYFLSVCITIIIELVTIKMSYTYNGLRYYANAIFHYNFITCFVGALGFFCAFINIKLKEGNFTNLVRYISKSVFSVYLIHEQIDVSSRWYDWINELTSCFGISITTKKIFFIPVMIIQIIIMFIMCIMIDQVRLYINHFWRYKN